MPNMLSHPKIGSFPLVFFELKLIDLTYFRFIYIQIVRSGFLHFMAFLLDLQVSVRKHEKLSCFWGFQNGELHFCTFSRSILKSKATFIIIFCSHLKQDQKAKDAKVNELSSMMSLMILFSWSEIILNHFL